MFPRGANRAWSMLAALVLLGSGSQAAEAPSRPTPGGEPITAEPRSLSAQTQRDITAMLSVLRHTTFAGRHFSPEVEKKFERLPDAGRVLAADARENGPLARSRRYRAIALVAAYGHGEEATETLRILGAPEALVVATDARPDEGACQAGSQAMDETAAFDTLVKEQGPAIPNCPVSSWTDAPELESEGAFPKTAPVATVTTTLKVERRVDDVRKDIDPQSWDGCSKYFCPPENAYLTTADPDDPNHHYEIDPITKLPKAMTPLPAPGTAYPRGVLFENFRCLGATCNFWFTNLLEVTPTWDDKVLEYKASYRLYTQIANSVLGVPDLVFQDDSGYVHAQDDSGKTTAQFYKRIKFRETTVTLATYNLWALTEAERVQEFAEVVCCGVIPPTERCQ